MEQEQEGSIWLVWGYVGWELGLLRFVDACVGRISLIVLFQAFFVLIICFMWAI